MSSRSHPFGRAGWQSWAGSASRIVAISEMADALLSLRDYANLAGVFAFTVGALQYYSLFDWSRLIPRWLSGWGVAGALLIVTACLVALFSHRPVTSYTLLILPIAVQEIVLAVWLLVKGFNSPPQTPRASADSSTPLSLGHIL